VLPLNPLAKPAERTAVAAELQRRGLGMAHRGEVLAEAGAAPAVSYALLTGGSTGTPKPVLFPAPLTWSPHTYPNPLLARTGWRDDQRQLIVAPLHHAAAFSVFLAGVLCGNTIALLPAFHPDLFWQTLADLDIDWLLLTPAHMRAALPHPGRPEMTVLHTGAPCEPEVKRAWLDLVGPQRLFEMYGSTEGTGVTLVRGDEWLARPGTVGRGVWTRIRVLDEDSREVPTGTVGEVYLRTPAPPRLRHPGQRATPDGYLSIGDHGRVDEDGYLYLSGRGDDLIIVGGENVYPAEIEAVLRGHPDVVDAAVVGFPDPVFGQRARAFVVARGVSVDDLRRHCARRLSSFKLPAEVTFVDELPRSALGKLQRWRLT
jgi:bile acid-coenzyme A ligase